MVWQFGWVASGSSIPGDWLVVGRWLFLLFNVPLGVSVPLLVSVLALLFGLFMLLLFSLLVLFLFVWLLLVLLLCISCLPGVLGLALGPLHKVRLLVCRNGMLYLLTCS